MPVWAGVPAEIVQPQCILYQRQTSKIRAWINGNGPLLDIEMMANAAADGRYHLMSSFATPLEAEIWKGLPQGYPVGTVYARFSFGGRQIEFNTRIRCPVLASCRGYLSVAVSQAVRREYHRLREIDERGEEVRAVSRSIADGVQTYIKHLKNEEQTGHLNKNKSKNTRDFLQKYVLGWESVSRIKVHQFGEKQVADWQAFRNKEAGRLLARSTLDKHNVYFRSFFNYARVMGWINAAQMPAFTRAENIASAEERRRPLFRDFEWNQLEERVPLLIEEPSRQRDKLLRETVWYCAIICRAYALRVAEAYSLYFRNLEWDGKTPILCITDSNASKNHTRDVDPIRPQETSARNVLREKLPNWFRRVHGRDPRPDDLLFSHPDRPDVSLGRSPQVFGNILEAAGLLYSTGGHKRSLTSCRHTAITEIIEKTNISEGVICRYAGTSSEMLRKHYNQALTRRAMRDGWQQRERISLTP